MSPSSALQLNETPLRGRHAIVTGAARGIGAAIATLLAAHGARLTLLGRRREPLEQLCRALSGGPHGAVLADVADPAQVRSAFDEARAARGAVAILINNAGAA
jgi:NAD(P)-dependent dehydrogenase (short-subunit alcohol dehydrogenase family)